MKSITLESPEIDEQVSSVSGLNRAGRRAFASLAKLAAKGKVPSAFPLMGGSPVASPVHPLGPPSVNGSEFTIDFALANPTIITRMIMDLTQQRFIADRVFSNAGTVTGGAVIYDQAVANELYLTRDVERVAPGDEFPVVDAERRTPKIAEVEKWGGKVFIPDEAKTRNQTALFANKVRQLANTQVRKINQRSVAVLMAAITEHAQTFTGRDWTDVIVGGSSQSNADEFPIRDLVYAARMAEEDELGVDYTLLLLNPQEYAQLVIIYGAAGINDLLSSLGLSIYVSNRVPAGTGIFVAEGQVGEMRLEKPLGTVTWREEKTERDWVQSSVRPVQYVTNPFSVLQVTGLAG